MLELPGYFFDENYKGSAKTGARLSKAYDKGSADIIDEGLLAAPFLNAAYFVTDDKKNFVGLTAGFLGSIAAGVSLYGVATIDRFDYLGAGTLQLVAGLDFLTYFADSELSELNEITEDGTRYDLDDGLDISPRFGIIWRF